MSLRRAINDKCKDCIYDPASEGTWRQQAFSCSVIICPLWHVRPKPISSVTERVKPQSHEKHDNPLFREIS